MRSVAIWFFFLVSLLCLPSPAAASSTVGRFVLPDSLQWKRLDRETDRALEGLCVAVQDGDGVANVIVFARKGIECERGRVRARIDRAVQGFKETLKTDEVAVLNIDGRAWRGVRAFDADQGITYYFGCTYRELEMFPVHILRRSRGAIPDDLRSFLRRTKIASLYPSSPSTAFINRGNSLVSQKRYREALREFDRGIERDPDHWPLWYYRGMCQRRMRDYAGAERSLKKALRHGDGSTLHLELAKTLSAAGEKREALQSFAEALRLNPENDNAFLYRGNLHMRGKDYDRALTDFDACLGINPCSRAAGFNSAEILYHIKKKPAEAAARLDQVLQHNPGYERAIARRRQVRETLAARPDAAGAGATAEALPADTPPTIDQLPEWVANLPDVPEVQPVPVAPGIDYSALTDAQYAGAVRAAKEACRRLLGPLSAAQQVAFEEKWQPMLDYPAPPCVEYLQKLVPVVEKALGTRAALADNLLVYDRLWNEAGYAAYYDEAAGAQVMEAVARQAAVLESLKETMQALMEEMAALGDPPDAAQLKAQASSRHERAMRALRRLLGKSAPLQGAYDRTDRVSYEYYNDDRDKPYFSMDPVRGRLCRHVYLPLSKDPTGPVLFYQFVRRAPSKGGGLFSLDLGPENFNVFYAEPEAGVWVAYDYDEEDGETTATFYRPTETQLIIDEFILRDGELQEAEREAFARRPLDGSIKRYPDEMDAKKLNKLLREHKADLQESVRLFDRGRQAFQRYVRTNGFLPEMPRPGGLHWVLKDVQVTSKFDREVQITKTQFTKEKIENTSNRVERDSLSAEWKKTTIDYEMRVPTAKDRGDHYVASPDEEGDSVAPKLVPARKKEEESSANLGWSPPPLAIPDGGYWPLRVRGSGQWVFSLNHSFDIKGRPSPVHTAALFANRDSLFVYERPPQYDTEISSFRGIPDDGELMTIDPEKQGGDHLRCLLFRSDGIQQNQSDYLVSLVVISEGGWMKVNCLYELKDLDEAEADYLLRKTAEQNEDAARMLASLEAAGPKGSPPTASTSAEKKEAREMRAERIEFHQANIAFCRTTIERLEGDLRQVKSRLHSGKAAPEDVARYNDLVFKITCQKSNVISERDRINELKTGEVQFSRTPFDEMCRMQTVQKVEQEVRRLDAADRARRKAELLAGKLSGGQRRKARELIDKTIAEGGATDPARWEKLNGALQNIYQGEQLQEIAKIEEEIAWKQAQIDAASNIKAGAQAGVTVLSLAGGPLYVTTLYQTGTGFAEGGILEGVKRGLTTWSDAADIAVSGYRGWKKGGWLGMVEGASWSILLNKGPEAALNRINMRAMRGTDLEINAKPAAKAAGDVQVTRPKPVDLSPTRAAQFKQELEYGESMAEDFFRSHRRLRTAEIKGKASPEELTRLRMEVRQKAAAVAHSMPAKSYLKYRAQPIKGRAYSETMDDILEDASSAFNWEMRNRGYNKQTLYHCRNASSKGAGMDSDLALKEQPDMIPVRGENGEVSWQKNNWLTRDGKPVSVHDYQKEGSAVLQEAYKKVTGGYSAKQSFVDMTTSVGKESYPDLTWLKLPKHGRHTDAGGVTKKLDQFFGKVDPSKVPDSLKITTTKAEIMFKEHPELRPLGSMMESCRGTAKDLETKFIPLVEHNIRKINAIPAAKRTTQQAHQLAELQQTKDYLGECLGSFKDIGEGRIPPYEWERQFRLTTGGSDPVAVIRRLTKMTEDATTR